MINLVVIETLLSIYINKYYRFPSLNISTVCLFQWSVQVWKSHKWCFSPPYNSISTYYNTVLFLLSLIINFLFFPSLIFLPKWLLNFLLYHGCNLFILSSSKLLHAETCTLRTYYSTVMRGCNSVVECSLRMRKAPGSIPGTSSRFSLSIPHYYLFTLTNWVEYNSSMFVCLCFVIHECPKEH